MATAMFGAFTAARVRSSPKQSCGHTGSCVCSRRSLTVEAGRGPRPRARPRRAPVPEYEAPAPVALPPIVLPPSTLPLPKTSADWSANPIGASGVKAGSEVAAFKDAIFANNRAWAKGITEKDPEFWNKLSKGQSPEILWIGCADSRMPANSMIGKMPGEVFVHRNVANVVCHTDFNCLSVLEYAVNVLGVSQVIVCGHTQCGGVKAALGGSQVGLVDNWLRHIRDVRAKYHDTLEALPEAEAFDKMVELNIMEQVKNVCSTSIVQSAWRRGKKLAVHGWLYDINDGYVKELGVQVMSSDAISQAYIAEPALV